MSTYSTALSADERKNIELAIPRKIKKNTADPGALDLARTRASAMFSDLEEGSNPDLERLIRGLVVDGLVRSANRVLKATRSTVKLRTNGRVVSLAARRGVRKVDANGVALRTFQQSLFWELPWDRFLEHVADMERQRNTMGVKIAALYEVVALRERFPQTATPLEACELAGIDPQKIGFEASRAA